MDKVKTALTALGYSAWFGFLFTVFLWLTFPWGKVNENLTVEAADRGIAYKADSLRPAIVGAKAKGLIVGPLSPGGRVGPWLQADSLRVKTGLGGTLSALLAVRAISAEGGAANEVELTKRILAALGDVRLDGEMYGDTVEIVVADEDSEAMRFDLETGRLDLGAYTIPGGLFAQSPTGRLKAEADVLWHWDDAKKTSGSVDLVIDDLLIDGLAAFGLTLPTLTFDRSEAHLQLAKGRAEFRDTAFEADKGAVEVEGFINLKPKLLSSTYSLQVKFKVQPELEGLLSIAGLNKNSRHRDDEGWYHYQVQGRLTNPRFKERRVGGAASRGSRSAVEELGGTDEDGMTPAEKRKAARDAARARRANADEDENEEPLGRNTMSDDRREEIEAQRAKLREERLKRREERRQKREELMQRRRERMEAGEDVGVVRTPTITPDDFDRTNDPDEGDEGDYGDEGEFEGEFEDGSGPGDGDYEDEGDYAE